MTPDELRKFLFDKRWSQTRAAKEFGVDQATVSNWIRGAHRIPKLVDKLVKCLEGKE